ncbi:MAG: sialidase family protein, partial [Nitrososphaeraceae archaeon]
MYPTYAQNIGPAQGAQPNDQGRPLSNYAPVSPSNTAGNFTTPLDLNNTAGNFTTPLDLNNTAGNFSGAPNQLNNFTSPAGNPQEGAPAGNEGGLGPNNQSLANQATPNMNNTIPPPKPVIFTKNLSNNSGTSSEQKVATSGSNVYVAWEDTSSGANSDILFARSGNNGATFGNVTTNLSNNTGESTNPRIAAFRNNVYVAWEDYSLLNSIKNQILFSRSTNNGMTFDNTIRLSNNTGESTNPKIAAFRNNVYVAWEDTSAGANSDIAFTRSPNNGATFGNVINVNAITGQPLPGQPLNPQIFASGSNVYIAWTNHNVTTGNDVVLFAKSSNNGIAFSDIRSLSNPGGESVLPQIATSGNNVYVTWSYDDTSKATENANSTLGSSDVIFLRGTSGNFPGSSLLGPQFAPGANISGGAAPPPSGGGSEFAPGGSIQGGAAPPPSGGGFSNPGVGSEFAPGGSIQGGAAPPPSGGGFSNPGVGSEFAPGGSIQGG